MIPIGHGVAVGLQGGMLHAVSGPLWAQIEQERADGPRYVEAVRGADNLRTVAACWAKITPAVGGMQLAPFETWRNADGHEIACGIPVDWITR